MVDTRLCTLLKSSSCRIRKNDDLDIMSEKEFDNLLLTLKELIYSAKNSKQPNVIHLAVEYMIANGRLSNRMLFDLFNFVAVNACYSSTDFSRHFKPVIEQLCLQKTTDGKTIQQMLG